MSKIVFTISPFYWLFCNFNIEISCLVFKYYSKIFQLFSILFCWAYGTRTHNSRTKILRVTITPKPNIKSGDILLHCPL